MLIVMGSLLRDGVMQWGSFVLASIVALSGQIASNIANDYFDYLGGKDTSERVGFSRVLTTGSVTPRQMLLALLVAIGVCALSGLALCALCGWEFLMIGIAVVVGVIAYSAGPFPLSSHGLGDLAVVLFYGLIPVLVTYFAIAGMPPVYLYWLALGIGVWETNILVSNNYRDYEEDCQSGKRTLIVRMGKEYGPKLYRFNAMVAALSLSAGIWLCTRSLWRFGISLLFLGVCYCWLSALIGRLKGRQLNYLLKATTVFSVLTALLVLCLILLD